MQGLLFPEDVNCFLEATEELMARQLQWHTIAVTLYFSFISFASVFPLPYTCDILLLLCYQAARLTYILDERMKELVEDVEREKALKDVAEDTTKEKGKVADAVEKRA